MDHCANNSPERVGARRTFPHIRTIILVRHGDDEENIHQTKEIESYQSGKETKAMMKLAALGRKSVERGKVKPARKAFESIERNRKKRRG